MAAFATGLIANAFVGFSSLDANFMGGDSLSESRNGIYNGLHLSLHSYLQFYLTPPKKHVFNSLFALLLVDRVNCLLWN